MAISVAIVAFNEAANIRRTLESVAWADEIVVVDSGSADATVAIAHEFDALVFIEAWKGYGPQVNSAIDKCTCEWIFSVDADEVVSPTLAAEIRALCQDERFSSHMPIPRDPEIRAYTVPRLNLIFGRWMRHGGLYPDRKLRIFERGTARLREDTEPHATPKWEGKTGALKGDLLHHAYPSIDAYFDHMDRYSTASIPLVLRRRKTSRTLPAFVTNIFLNPVAIFLYNYILRGGFLDGREGLLFHLYHSAYVNQKFVKAWLASRNHDYGS